MTIERKWNPTNNKPESWKEIDEDRANRELANAHGDNAVEKLKEAKELKTRFETYRYNDK